MTTNTFTIPDSYQNKKLIVNQLINKYEGDYTTFETKDGTAYSVDFENDAESSKFMEKLNSLIPDLYKY